MANVKKLNLAQVREREVEIMAQVAVLMERRKDIDKQIEDMLGGASIKTEEEDDVELVVAPSIRPGWYKNPSITPDMKGVELRVALGLPACIMYVMSKDPYHIWNLKHIRDGVIEAGYGFSKPEEIDSRISTAIGANPSKFERVTVGMYRLKGPKNADQLLPEPVQSNTGLFADQEDVTTGGSEEGSATDNSRANENKAGVLSV
jgi:hypothetical protein